MRFLFLSYTYPGPLGSIAAWLAKQLNNQVFFASSRFRQEQTPDNVHRIILKKHRSSRPNSDNYLDVWEDIIKTGKNAASSLEIVRDTGFIPDIVFNASINGINAGCSQTYSHAFVINFLEDCPETNSGYKARQQLQCLQIIDANLNFSFSKKLIRKLPHELKTRITLLPRLMDCDFFSPVNATRNAIPSQKYFIIVPGEADALFVKAAQLLNEKFPDFTYIFLAENSFILRKLQNISFSFQPTLIASPRQDGLRDLFAFADGCLFLNNGDFLLEAMSCACPCITPGAFKRNSGLTHILTLEKLLAKSNPDFPKEELIKHGRAGRREIYDKFALSRIMPELYNRILTRYEDWKRHP